MSHVTHDTHEWVMSHIFTSYDTHMNESCHTYTVWMRHITYITHKWTAFMWKGGWVIIHIWHTYEWVVSHMTHIWMSHVTHLNESCHTCDTHINESCHTYATHMNATYMTHKWIAFMWKGGWFDVAADFCACGSASACQHPSIRVSGVQYICIHTYV